MRLRAHCGGVVSCICRGHLMMRICHLLPLTVTWIKFVDIREDLADVAAVGLLTRKVYQLMIERASCQKVDHL